jgi:hypothetical protein
MIRAMRMALGTLVTLALPSTALAHIKLLSPPAWIVTNSLGDPQKTAPCGSNSAPKTGTVTKVKAGSKLKVTWTETVFHPGHFRISIAADRAQFTNPKATVQNNNCRSAEIQTNPTPPVIADGIFPHTSRKPGGMYEYEITVPDITCTKCTLQLLQFMSSHAPPCFYYHCADLQITQDAVSPGDGGADLPKDGGHGDLDAGSSTSEDAHSSEPKLDAAAAGSHDAAASTGAGGTGGGAGGSSGGTGGSGATARGGTSGSTRGTGGAGVDDDDADPAPPAKASKGGCTLAAPAGRGQEGLGLLLLVSLAAWRARFRKAHKKAVPPRPEEEEEEEDGQSRSTGAQ